MKTLCIDGEREFYIVKFKNFYTKKISRANMPYHIYFKKTILSRRNKEQLLQ